MKGAIVFLLVFAIVIALTLFSIQQYGTEIPPGRQLYNLLNVPDTDYLVANAIPATPLAISLINGAVYGIVVWLIFSLATMGSSKDKKENITVNVNVSGNPQPQSPPPPQN